MHLRSSARCSSSGHSQAQDQLLISHCKSLLPSFSLAGPLNINSFLRGFPTFSLAIAGWRSFTPRGNLTFVRARVAGHGRHTRPRKQQWHKISPVGCIPLAPRLPVRRVTNDRACSNAARTCHTLLTHTRDRTPTI